MLLEICILLGLYEKVICSIIPDTLTPFRTPLNKECYDSEQSGKLDQGYSGFKISKVYKFHTNPINFTNYLQVVYCQSGKKIWEKSDQVDVDDMQWEVPLEVNFDEGKWFFSFVKRDVYRQKKFSLFLPGTWVGGFFLCADTQCKRNEIIPLMPLYADDYRNHWKEVNVKNKFHKLEVTKTVPFLKTPLDKVDLLKLVSERGSTPGVKQNTSTIPAKLQRYKERFLRKMGITNLRTKPDSEWTSHFTSEYEDREQEGSDETRKNIDTAVDIFAEYADKPHQLVKEWLANGTNMSFPKWIRSGVHKVGKKLFPIIDL
ncbi:uncharacterized protein KNAG_0F01830 [Huiozyma naganishii CBS 8797]|uniref:Uncharacterized protein n=1 Tax=Huiozyma naganishii (strain ATCC MYA-139 / BCRC 22969 / CBS 8797 / KCTC 17520 / NBRC 10181 / NCYC 3082 / Yp74L-3) TaxID=1071383 RepID=J7S8C7_HUIN7|nr:hypothetical protein KNAG_0F01830 [Kazachstania naganishii CBS 8797]CCK70851.1 hypothetical protein KNAG_0F01830 [Kazachstania naganishii CBS 8797]